MIVKDRINITSLDDVEIKNLDEMKSNMKLIKKKYSANYLYNAEKLEVRESITGKCNFRCVYCSENTTRAFDQPYEFWIKLNAVLAAFGITGIHHTGGEPTSRKNLAKYIKVLKEIGYSSQVMTTNGARPDVIQECIDAGLTRANISLDTLDAQKFSKMSRVESYVHKRILESIDIASERLNLIKLNTVVTKDNFDEIKDLFLFAQSKKAVLRLIELYPYGPSIESRKFDYDAKHVPKNNIISELKKMGELKPCEVEGLNAVPKYYKIGDYEVPIAIISPTWIEGGATCGREKCRRLRAGASGNITYCNNIPEIKGDEYKELGMLDIAEKISSYIYKKNERIIINKYPNRHPFAYTKLRFGKVD